MHRGTQARLRRLGQALAVVLCGLFVPIANSAQPPLPGPASPDRIEQRFQPPSVPKATPEITIPGPEAPTPPAEALKIDFILSAVILDDSTVYKPTDLTPLTANLIGKKISLAQVFALRDALTAKYRRDGYILSQVIVPPQKVTDGVVHMQAVEGYVSNVNVQGDAHDSRGLIADMAERIKAARPLTAKALERYVLLMQDLPGLSVRTVLRPAGNLPGAADLDLVVTHKTVTGYASVDNRGSKAIGPLQGQVGINLNSLFGRNDRTALQFATVSPVDELQYAAIQHDEILSPDGTRLSLAATYSHSRPRGALVNLNPLGNSLSLRAGVDYPVIRSRARTLRVGAAFAALDSRVDLLGTKFSEDKVRYLSFTANYDVADTLLGDSRPASTLISTELSQGLDILGATQTGSLNLSRANGHSNFTRLYTELNRTQTIAGRFGLALSAAAQAATTLLLSAQRFGLGGSRIGRGYEPSEILGDNGLAASIEARYNLPAGDTIFINPQLYLFYDIGKVWNINPAVGEPSSQSLASAGPGMRFDLFRNVSANIEVAKPLTRDIASRSNRDTRLLFSIISRF
jgi:hemolysin activation/secretion protein